MRNYAVFLALATGVFSAVPALSDDMVTISDKGSGAGYITRTKDREIIGKFDGSKMSSDRVWREPLFCRAVKYAGRRAKSDGQSVSVKPGGVDFIRAKTKIRTSDTFEKPLFATPFCFHPLNRKTN